MEGVQQAIAALRKQRADVDVAITALEALTGTGTGAAPVRKAKAKRRGDNMSKKGRQRQIAAMKRYWREKKKAAKAAKETSK